MTPKFVFGLTVLAALAASRPGQAAADVPAALPAAATSTVATAVRACRPGTPGLSLKSARVHWRISPCLGGIESARLLDEQFHVPARTPPAGLAPWAASKFAAGQLELVDTWDAKWDPARDALEDLAPAPQFLERGAPSDPGHALALTWSQLRAREPVWGVVQQDARSVTLVWPDARRIKSPLYIEKRYTLQDANQPFSLKVDVTIWNLSNLPQPFRLVHGLTTFQDPGSGSSGFLAMFAGMPDIMGAGYSLGGELVHFDAKSLADADADKRAHQGLPDWCAVDSRYFLLASVPTAGFDARADVRLTALANGVVEARLRSGLDTVAGGAESCQPAWFTGTWPGRTCTATEVKPNKVFSYIVFSGPKELDLLRPIGHGLETAIDFGWFGVIARPMLAVLKFAHGLSGSWPLAILILTILVKALLWPITGKSMKSMRNMQKIKPELDKLRTELEAKAKKQGKDKADPQELNQATFALYKKHNVNPLGGCLPLLLQMPIYIALYRTINASVDLYNQPLFGWVTDLTQKDPYYVLPAVLGAVMFLQQKLTPQAGGDPMQQKMMLYFMPALFTLMMLQLPSGLTLYILTNTVLGIVQTMVYNRADTSAPKA